MLDALEEELRGAMAVDEGGRGLERGSRSTLGTCLNQQPGRKEPETLCISNRNPRINRGCCAVLVHAIRPDLSDSVDKFGLD